jgi:hypothetical protein
MKLRLRCWSYISPTNTFRIMNNDLGYVPLEESANFGLAIPAQILDGGNHFDDINRTERHKQFYTNMLSIHIWYALVLIFIGSIACILKK